MRGFLLQNSPQHCRGFEVFFEQCLETLEEDADNPPWVFLRGDGVYQGVSQQRLDEPGFTVPIAGGWRALSTRGVTVLINRRCAKLRGFSEPDQFIRGAKLSNLEELARLCMQSDQVSVL